MHIALCDDNVADRKQFERLLKRESDRRASTTGILFADSFGNAQALLQNPMQYDVFYLDLCHTPETTVEAVVAALTEKGVNAPIVLCNSLRNYRDSVWPENVFFLDKPIKVADLTNSISHALEIKAAAEPMIELREDKGTHYVKASEILYAVEEGRMLLIHLTGGRLVTILDSAENLFSQLSGFPCFLPADAKSFVNGDHVTEQKWRKVWMDDGKALHLSHTYAAGVKHYLESTK